MNQLRFYYKLKLSFIFAAVCLSYNARAVELPQNGIFQQTCKTINEDDYVQFEIRLQKDGSASGADRFVFSVAVFEDENCLSPYLLISREFDVDTYDGKNLNLITNKITYTSLTDEVTSALNLSRYCGIKSWQTKKPQEVSGRKCNDYLQLAKKQKYFQILSIEFDRLLFGSESREYNGLTEKSRPIGFESLPYNLKTR